MNNTEYVVEYESISIEKNKKIYFATKRVLDFLLSFIALIILSPLLLIIALAIKLDTKGPVFFKHKRIGKNGEDIYLYKFRTMVTNAEELKKNFTKEQIKEYSENFKLDNDPRITKVGRLLRKTSLDELPQLLNIFKGEMAIVGPRPVVTGEIDKYGKNRDKFLSVLPGLTGWWACNGRSCTSYEDRIALELYYVDNCSLIFDIKVILRTVVAVIKGHGAK